MKLNPQLFASRRRAFTLVEVIVAMTVLIAVTVMITSLVNNVSRTTELGTRNIDTDSVARSFFNRLSLDLDNMLIRDDISYGFEKVNNEDDTLTFYTAQTGPQSGDRPISVVSYARFAPGSSRPEVQRAIRNAANTSSGSSWTAAIFTDTPVINLQSDDATFGLANTDYQGFGTDIIRLEYNFLIKDNQGLRAQNTAPANIGDLKGIVVAVAIADPRTHTILSDTEIADLAGRLGDAANDSVDITSDWRSTLKTYSEGGNSPSHRAARNLRLYQRIFLIQ